MRTIYKKHFILLLFSVWALIGYTQTGNMQQGPYLFTDRDFCISGDSVWFKATHKNGNGQKGNVVRVQLTNSSGRVIASAIKKSTGGWAEGFIFVPDTLSSGVYFLSAYFNWQRTTESLYLQKKSLFVYNRFQKMMAEFPVPSVFNNKAKTKSIPGVSIKPVQTTFKPGDRVTAGFDLESLRSAGIEKAVIKAELLDELAVETGGNFIVESVKPQLDVPLFEESDGILISGRVVSPVSKSNRGKVVVLFSLLNDPLYFDYSIPDDNGLFHFFLKNACGVGDIVLQPVSERGEEWQVMLETMQFGIKEPVALEKRVLTAGQMKFIEDIVDAAYYKRLFGESFAPALAEFSITHRSKMPFYGHPHKRVVLSDFIDLPNFQEVSRELLNFVQYRQNGNDITLRMQNQGAKDSNNSQPLRLINGIPVFRNSLLAPLGSDEIDYIDYVLEDRIFGDIMFNGVLAVYLKDRSNVWMSQQSNMFRFTVPLLQTDTFPSYINTRPVNDNMPDLRNVFYWQLHETDKPFQIGFLLSDIKGKVKISVEGITAEGEFFNVYEIIEVK